MSAESRTDIQKIDDDPISARPEQTRSGTVYTPAVDIFENDSAITVLADMPGVKASDLRIDLRESVLTLTGRVSLLETSNELHILREYEPGMFFRQFSVGEMIEQSKIDAQLRDGVLRLELPKAERARPRQIAVRSE
jgi:HSP20 family molecular chaperone IbpA